MSVDVSVLVPVRDEEFCIREVLETMRAQRYPGRVELLFIDSGSRDRTRQILEGVARDDRRMRFIDNPQGSISHGLNLGLRHARGRYVARMDAHTFYPYDYLATGVRWLERGAADWVAGTQLPYGVDRWSERIAHALTSPLGIGGARFRRSAPAPFAADSGFTGIWRRETLDRLHGWDERWVVNEDGELAARLRERGGRILCVPEMAARWVPRRSLRGLVRQYWRYGQYRARTCRHHPASMRRSHLLPPTLALTTAGGLLRVPPVRPCRGALAAYALVVVAEAARLGLAGVPARDAAALPAIFASMHLAWGCGFVVGCARFGVPFAAIGTALRGGSRRLDLVELDDPGSGSEVRA